MVWNVPTLGDFLNRPFGTTTALARKHHFTSTSCALIINTVFILSRPVIEQQPGEIRKIESSGQRYPPFEQLRLGVSFFKTFTCAIYKCSYCFQTLKQQLHLQITLVKVLLNLPRKLLQIVVRQPGGKCFSQSATLLLSYHGACHLTASPPTPLLLRPCYCFAHGPREPGHKQP